MNRIEKIAKKKIGNDRIEKCRIPYLYSAIENFIKNGRNVTEKNLLFNIVEETSYYTFSDIWVFFQNFFSNYIEYPKKSILQFDGKGPSSSQTSIISSLCKIGYFSENSIIISDQLITIPKKWTLFIVDDYCGSGDTVTESIKLIEKYCVDCIVFIVIFVVQEDTVIILKEFVKNLRNQYILKFGILESRYDRKIKSKNTISYANKMCEYCSVEYRYGYKNTGALLSLEGKSPNNSISIIWKEDILIDDRKWIPLFNRKRNEVAFIKHKFKQISKNQEFIIKYFKESELNKIISISELEFLIKVYNFTPSIIELEQTINYLGNNNLKNIVLSLTRKEIIALNEGYVRIKSYVILGHLKKIEEHFLRSEKKRIKTQLFDVGT